MASKVVRLGKSAFKSVLFESPYTVMVDFANSAKADMACLIPSVRRLTGTKVEYMADKYSDLYNMFEAITVLAQSVR
jgi:D-aminopeptidase